MDLCIQGHSLTRGQRQGQIPGDIRVCVWGGGQLRCKTGSKGEEEIGSLVGNLGNMALYKRTDLHTLRRASTHFLLPMCEQAPCFPRCLTVCLSYTVLAKLMSGHRCSRAGGKRPESCGGFGRGGMGCWVTHQTGLGQRMSGWREEAGFGGRAENGGEQRKSEDSLPGCF